MSKNVMWLTLDIIKKKVKKMQPGNGKLTQLIAGILP